MAGWVRSSLGTGCLLGLIALGGCAGAGGPEGTSGDSGSMLANLMAFNTTTPEPAKSAVVSERIDCPKVEVLDGTASLRTFSGTDESNGSLKHQFSLGDVVRECSRSGNQLVLKVGVEGRLLLGPQGAPGAFTAPVRIAIRREKDQQATSSKIYSVPVSIASGQSVADFTVVSDPISVPFTQQHADDDYTIVVGFDAKGAAAAPGAAARARRGRRS